MCGIAGIYEPKGVAEDVLKRMSDKIAHRGPDSDGFFVQNGFGLAHRRLSIIDLSTAANQPIFSQDNRYAIVYNGEVYNHKEIAKELPIQLKTHSDTEVILEAFAQWGPKMVNRLNGMFAIAIFDKLEEKLYLFRDRVGIKPLFIYQKNGVMAFGSELKALTALKDQLEFTLNRDAIPYFLHLGYIPQPITIYNEIEKFPSGHWAVFDGIALKTECYWNPADKISATVLSDETEAKNQLEKLLKASVKKRLMSDVPFGTFLSGGVDSSLVTALAQEESAERLKTFSIGFENAKHDESKYARQVAEHLGTEHFEYKVTEKDALDLVEDILLQYDEPYADSSAIPTMLVSKMARQEVTMTLSGDGGDELFMGYGAYTWANRLSSPLLNTFRKPIGTALSFGNDRQRRAANLFQYSSSDNLPAHIFSQEQYLFSRSELDRLVLNSNEVQFPLLNQAKKLNRALSPAERQAFFDLEFYLKDDLLTKVDRASMRYSLEARVPLLDHETVEFALNLDENLKIKNGTQKYLLKQVLYDKIPKEVFNRPKWGFSIPLSKWLNSDLSYLIDESLNKKKVEETGFVQWNAVEKLVNSYRSGQEHLYNRIWVLILLHSWKA
ncbi:MAG: asparagine synthase (glutamine-hydrolyzing) [Flavobacteriales bacterium]|nr:asparagine synthase (glutamine-hydrolyzing) [Flavobacteriales bacterium]